MCIFPASGNRNGTGLNNRGTNGNYWSSSLNSQTNGYNLNFNASGVNPANNNNRFNGFSVRAVQHSSIFHQSVTKKWPHRANHSSFLQTSTAATA